MLQGLKSILGWIGHNIEHALVLAVEGLRRSVLRFDPRLYSERRRVRCVSEGRIAKDTGRYAVFVLFCSGPLPSFTKNFVEAIGRSRFNLVAVANCVLASESRIYLLEHCRWLIERDNVGRDFGGYKDGISIVLQHASDVERLVIANDSVFYLSDGLDDLISDLNSEGDFVGVSEVFDHHYHVSSFLISFGPNVLRSKVFPRFWERYLPIATRRWAIFRGEGALSRELIDAGFKPTILFQAEHLRGHLRSRLPAELHDLVLSLPEMSRQELCNMWGIDLQTIKASGARLELKSLFGVKSDADLSERLADDLIQAICAHNQMHTAGLLFRKNLGLPMLKRDLCYREVYPLDELPAVLCGIDGPIRAEIESDILQRGTPARLDPVRRLFYRHGAI